MFSELALWQEIALFVLAFLSMLYVFYFRIWVAVAMASDALFAAALVVCVASVAIPEIFDAGARRAVDASPLPQALFEADAKVVALESLPAELIVRALEKIGYERTDEAPIGATSNASRAAGGAILGEGVSAEGFPPAEGSPPADGSSFRAPGPFESRVRPAAESLVAVLLRGTSCVASFFLLLMALALRSSTSTARELHALSARLERLEASKTVASGVSASAASAQEAPGA
jgi:hypothetical protein